MHISEAPHEIPRLGEADPRWEVVTRVAASSGFQRSPRLKEFLLYVCRKALENEFNEIREQRIGYHVFGRRPDYNPSEDNIVRVEARLLRKRLEEYFSSDGREEKLIITIPKGSYVPRFAECAPENVPPAAAPALLLPESRIAQHPAAPNAKSLYRSLLISGFLLAAGVGVGSWMLGRSEGMRGTAQTPFWASLFNDNQTLVICADSAWVLRSDILGKDQTLEDYIGSNYPGSYSEDVTAKDPATRLLRTKQYTSMADVRVLERMLLANPLHWKHTVVKSARDAQVRDFKNGNVVMIGSTRAIPWEWLFRDQLNFFVEYDTVRRVPLVRNAQPRGREPAVYYTDPGGNQAGNTYSAVAYIPNLTHTGNILIIAGSSMEACEAAGEFLTDPEQVAAFVSRLDSGSAIRPPYFELVLRSSTLAGSSRDSAIVAYRAWKAKS